MSYTQRFSESWQLIDYVLGAAVAANTETNSGYNSLANYHRVAIVIHPVSLGDALDVDIEQATTTAGTDGKTVDSGGKDITVATADTTPSVIELKTAELDVTGKFDCVNVEITTANTGGGSNYFVMEMWGMPRYLPASTVALDSVTD